MKRYAKDCTCGGWRFHRGKLIKVRWVGFAWEKTRERGKMPLAMWHRIRMANAFELWVCGVAITVRRPYLSHVVYQMMQEERWRRESGICGGRP